MSAGSERLADYPFHHAALGEFEFRSGRHETAREHFQAALGLARNSMERRFFDQRVSACERGDMRRGYYERYWERVLDLWREFRRAEVQHSRADRR
jgi:hypothetical protein